MIRHLFAIALIVLLGLSACGQTGDLFWPDDEQVEVEGEGEADEDEDETKDKKQEI